MVDEKEEAYRKRIEEMKKWSGRGNKLITDPETGESRWVPDESSRAFGPFSPEDLDRWVKEGKIPKKFVDAFKRQSKKTVKQIKELNRLKEIEASEEEISSFLTKHAGNLEERKKEMQESAAFTDFLIQNKDKILEVITDHEKKTFRQSRDIIDNKLDTNREKPQQMTFFDLELNRSREASQEEHVESLVTGLDLTEAEDNLLFTIMRLLDEKSENIDQNSPDFYMGNYTKGQLTIDNVDIETARMMIKPHELYSTYYGREDYGSDQRDHLLKVLNSLSEKVFLTTFNFYRDKQLKNGKTEKVVDKMRIKSQLFQLVILNKDLKESESQAIDRNPALMEGGNGRLLFKLTPVFTSAILDRYVDYPIDINQRIKAIASKKRHRTSQNINQFRDLLMRERQRLLRERKKGRISGQIGYFVRDEETLFSALKLDKIIKQGNRKRAFEYFDRGCGIYQELGLLMSIDKKIGSRGQKQYEIGINLDFK